MAQPSIQAGRRTLQAFLAAEDGGTGLEFVIIAAGVGLALSATLYVAGGVVTGQYEAVAAALKRQNN
jgi:Flp pilus assembly pilin Flp